MDASTVLMGSAQDIFARSGAADPNKASRPPIFKTIGVCLAVASGLFIGSSFVLKKKGLLRANIKYNEEAGEGYGYLKNTWWWVGMTLMIVGEILNFVAYAFTDAILVTPLGALAVVTTAVLSSIFLKERLSFVGKVACFLCVIGSVIIALNGPTESSAATIQDMQGFVIAPGFLSYAGVIVLVGLFLAFWAGPRYGKKSMMVYITICSLFGGLSVVATQGLGAAVITQAGGTPQFNQWFLYVLLVFVIATLLTEIIFLNKALNLFNAALVTPTYYVFFTSATIITSAVLFRGFGGTAASIITVVLGFLTICSGVILLQLSKSAKDVPDAAVFKGDLDQVRTVAEQPEPESEPKADAIRGTAALIRRMSQARQKLEADEAKKVYQDRLSNLQPIGEDEQFEWDGIRRRRTQYGGPAPSGSLNRRKTLHPPLGMTHFPDESEPDHDRDRDRDRRAGEDGPDDGGFIGSIRKRAKSVWLPGQSGDAEAAPTGAPSPMHPVPLTRISLPGDTKSAQLHGGDGSGEGHVYGLPAGLQKAGVGGGERGLTSPGYQAPPVRWTDESGVERSRSPPSTPLSPPSSARRQFSFQNVFHRHKEPQPSEAAVHTGPTIRPVSRLGSSRHGSRDHVRTRSKGATEEERLGLVKGDSAAMLPVTDYRSGGEDWELEGKAKGSLMSQGEEKEIEAQYESFKQRRKQSRAAEELPPAPPAKDEQSVDEEKGARSRKGSESRGHRGGRGGGSGGGGGKGVDGAFV
ncbi:MAG: hypothetical protein M1832_000867 [Thelocarpon impressellum]|nr:MAG: hypothetical protein M1832_000867 [Thelocarpon impressellum]